jgi:hypothetical protein
VAELIPDHVRRLVFYARHLHEPAPSEPGHELIFSNPSGLADKIIESGRD